MRIIGALIILLGFIIALIFDYIFFRNILSYLSILFFISPWFLFSISLKLEFNFFSNHLKRISFILVIYSIITNIIGILLNLVEAINIIFISLALMALLICWHFSLSLYRRHKIYFLVSGLFYNGIIALFCLQIDFLNVLIHIINIILVMAGILIILIVELNLRKIGYLKYIQ